MKLLGPLGVAQEVDPDVGPDRAGRYAGDLELDVQVLVGAEVARTGDCLRIGADQRQQPALDGALVQLRVVADHPAADQVEQRLQRDPLGVEQQLVARVEHAEVAEHLALGG